MYFKMFNSLVTLFYFYIRPLVKWFLHKFTRLSELQRICYGTPKGASRALGVEQSLKLSRTPEIINLVKELDDAVSHELPEENFKVEITEKAVKTVIIVKRIKPQTHPDFPKLFGICVEQIWGTTRLFHIVEQHRMTPYDCDNLEHERQLYRLWELLMPDVPLEARVTKQWQNIGFQGDDPKTDFRGMGILGLENLLFFATEYQGAARHVLSHSHHPTHGYTFAIVGINLTSMAYKLLKTGAAKTHIYNAVKTYPSLNTFHHLYCYLFYEFDKFWMDCRPRSIMDFSYIQERFEASILKALANENTLFRINLSVDNV